MTPEQPSLLVGSRFGAYRIVSRLGAGGMGVVYRAYDEKLQRHIAIKVLAASGPDAGAGARLLREARAAAALNHPHICTVHEVGEHDGQTFIAMELVEGQPLDRLIPRGTGLPADRVVRYGLQVADALAHAHQRGVVHRDLKTANIVISDDRAKVLDFGLAKRLVGDSDLTSESLSRLTAPGVHAGTPAYMAPEQLRGQPADARSDVWALGVVLHELAAGERPFAGDTLFELSAAILNESARRLPPHLPPALQAIVARCLEKDPASRFQKAADVVAALEGATEGRPLPAPATAPRSSRPKSRSVVIGVAALIAAAASAAVIAGLVARWSSAPPRYDSIAVLPLQDLSGGADQAHVVTGLHQGLTNQLAQLPGLAKVSGPAATRRFKDSAEPAEAIAQALGVRALVTGSVLRSGDRMQIAAQLIDGRDGRQVWGQILDRDASNIATAQNEIVAAIAQAINLRLRPEDRRRLSMQATVSPETYELYLRGMHELTSADDGEERAAGIAYLQKAVDRDPGDPHAYAGLARGYATLGHSPAAPEDAWIRARAAAERALTLAPDLADAHSALGTVKLYFERDWDGAERAFRRANELNPNLPGNHYHYAWCLFIRDRLPEAIAEHERARDLDPFTPRNTSWLAVLLAHAGRADEGIAIGRKLIETHPKSGVAWANLSFALMTSGRHDEAIEAAQQAVRFAPPWTFALGIAYAQAGRLDEARAALAKIESRPANAYNMWARAMLNLYLGDADGFFTALEKPPHHAFAPWVRMEPVIGRFKDDPRYGALFARFKLPLPK